MGAKFIGRVGPLAFALGVGVAVTLSSPGVAFADTSDSTTSSAASSSSGGQSGAGTNSPSDGAASTNDAAHAGDDDDSGAQTAGSQSIDKPESDAQEALDRAGDDEVPRESVRRKKHRPDAVAEAPTRRVTAVRTLTAVSAVRETHTTTMADSVSAPAEQAPTAMSVTAPVESTVAVAQDVSAGAEQAPVPLHTVSTTLANVLPAGNDASASRAPASDGSVPSSLLLGLLSWMRRQSEGAVTANPAPTLSAQATTNLAPTPAAATIAPATLAGQADIVVGSKPNDVVVAGTRAYVANLGSTTVSVVDTVTNKVISTIPVVAIPTALAVSKDGSRVYVAGYRGVSVINTVTNTVISTISTGYAQAGGIALAPNGSRAYVTQTNGLRVVVIDTAGSKVVGRVFVGFYAGEIAVSPDGTRAYVTLGSSNKVAIINTATNKVDLTVAVGPRPAGVALSSDGTRLYVTNSGSNTLSVIDTRTNIVAATVDVGGGPGSVVLSPDGQLAYVARADAKIAVVDTRTNTVTTLATIPSASGTGVRTLAVTPTGKTLYIADSTAGVLRVLTYTTPVDPTPVDPGGGVQSTPYLPFNMPVGPSDQKVFAHYVPWSPISHDNLRADIDYYATQLMTTTGENGIHSGYGGLLRDRPLSRDPINDPQWRYLDVLTEVAQAKSVGIDGFTVDISSISLQDTAIRNLLRAAAATPGFSIQPQADLSSGDIAGMTPAVFAAAMAPYLSSQGAFRLTDGRAVLSAFCADRQTTQWWTTALNVLRTGYGVDVAFVPTFLDANANMPSFAPISYGFGNWGGRNVQAVNPDVAAPGTAVDLVRTAHALGKVWMQPVAFQDNRPREGIFDESNNSQTNANSWEIAMNEGAEWVQLITWNDYAEGSAMAPSAMHGWKILDMQAYNIAQFKYGVDATVVRDAVYVSHRTQFANAVSTYVEAFTMKPRTYSPTPIDNVEVVVFATAPATVRATIGGVTSSCAVGAGRSVCNFGLRTGSVAVSLERGGAVKAQVQSPYQVVANPYTQNLEYHLTGGLR